MFSSSTNRDKLLCPIVLLMLGIMPSSPAGADSNGGVVANWAELVMLRSDDAEAPGAFRMEFLVSLEAEVGVTDVTVTTGGGSVWMLTNDIDTPAEWYHGESKASAAAIVAETNGTWTVEISASSSSTTTFTVNTGGLTDADFFPTPTGVSPAYADTSVPSGTNVSWNDPTGGATAEALFVSVDSDTLLQDDNTLFGSLLVTDTSWDPPLDLDPCTNVLEMDYVIADDTLIGTYNVTAGSIVWEDHPISAGIPGYPASSPLLAHGSFTRVIFAVINPCAADANCDNTVGIEDFLGILAHWGPCVGFACEFDSDNDDLIGITDFLKVLADWGPCP